MTEQLFNALIAIETLALCNEKVYRLPSSQSMDRRNDMAFACGLVHIIPAVQALARGQDINIHRANRLLLLN